MRIVSSISIYRKFSYSKCKFAIFEWSRKSNIYEISFVNFIIYVKSSDLGFFLVCLIF